MKLDIVLYTRQGCCLCDQAKALMQKYGLEVREVDINDRLELQQLYTHCVPVLFINRRERFRGRIDERLLHRILRKNQSDGR